MIFFFSLNVFLCFAVPWSGSFELLLLKFLYDGCFVYLHESLICIVIELLLAFTSLDF